MKPDLVIKTIESYLAAELGLLKIAYLSEEETFATPSASNQTWVRSVIRLGQVKEVELGRFGASIRFGELQLLIFTGPSKLRMAYQIAGDCEALLRRKALGRLELGEPETLPGQAKKGLQEALLLRCPFRLYQ